MHNIKDFGAIGDGVTVNTEAIQKAIDMGGTVYILSGVYVTGTLYLKSHGGLYLASGAVLKASTDRSDYNAADFCPQNKVFKSEFMAGTHLITAVEQEDIFIEGNGTIDGHSHFWVNESLKYPNCDFYGHPKESVRLAQVSLDRLRLDHDTRDQVLTLIARHDLPVEASRPWVGRWLSRLGPDSFHDLMLLKRADGLACGTPGNERDIIRQQAETLAREILDQTPCLTLKDLAINGRDAMAAGLEGPAVGQALKGLLARVAEGSLPNRREVLLGELEGNGK